MPFFVAHSAIGAADCATVKLVRTTYGDASVIIDEPAAITISGTFACVASGATAIAIGVSPKPARNATLSLTSSCAMRFETSGVPVSSFTISSIRFPATVAPCSCTYSFAAASICRPVDANGPVIGRISPTFTMSLPCAQASPGSSSAAAPASSVARRPASIASS